MNKILVNGYASRKFLITVSTILITAALAYFDKLSSDAALVFAAAIASYNWANAKGKET